ncbi:MAG: T9SS type A sorting domain-containing protein, partial [Bacteroidales bacterium]
STVTLSVPVGTLEAYQADSFWGQFANIVEDSTLAVEGNLVVDETKVYTIGGELMVSGVTNGTAIKVYNLNGVNVANSVVLDGAAQVELPTASGIYIVTVGNQSYKVVR